MKVSSCFSENKILGVKTTKREMMIKIKTPLLLLFETKNGFISPIFAISIEDHHHFH
jgi:hypothetical protein